MQASQYFMRRGPLFDLLLAFYGNDNATIRATDPGLIIQFVPELLDSEWIDAKGMTPAGIEWFELGCLFMSKREKKAADLAAMHAIKPQPVA